MQTDTAIVMEEILTNRMLALIEQEAGFLLLPPERAPAAPVHPSADDPAAGLEKEGGDPLEEEEEEADALEASQARKQRLLRALGVEEEGELRLLLTYFLRRQQPGAEEADETGAAAMVAATGAGVLEGEGEEQQEQGEGKQSDDDDQAEEEEAEAAMIRKLAPLRLLSCPEAEYAMIPPEEALDALQRFAVDRRDELERQRRRRARRQERARQRWQRGGSGEGDGAGEEDGCFWRRVAEAVLPDRHLRAWEGLARALVAYHRLLDERGRLLEGVVRLEKGNDGLRALVQGCMDDSINDHLLAPPFPRPPSPAPPSPVAAPKRAPLTPSSSSFSRRMTTAAAAAGAKRGGGDGGDSPPRTLRAALEEVGEVVLGGDFPKAEAKEGGEGSMGDFGTDGGVAAAAVSVVMEGAKGEGQEEEAK